MTSAIPFNPPGASDAWREARARDEELRRQCEAALNRLGGSIDRLNESTSRPWVLVVGLVLFGSAAFGAGAWFWSLVGP